MCPCTSEVRLDQLALARPADVELAVEAAHIPAVLHISIGVGNAPYEVVKERKAAGIVTSDLKTLARMR